MLTTFSDSINNFCLEKDNQCCLLGGLEEGLVDSLVSTHENWMLSYEYFGISELNDVIVYRNLRVEVFRRENFYFAGGYPKETDSNHFLWVLFPLRVLV